MDVWAASDGNGSDCVGTGAGSVFDHVLLEKDFVTLVIIVVVVTDCGLS